MTSTYLVCLFDFIFSTLRSLLDGMAYFMWQSGDLDLSKGEKLNDLEIFF